MIHKAAWWRWGRIAAEITDYASFQSLVSSFDKTVWLYDQPTGLLTNKLYADGQGPAYTYTPDGKLATRLWARGIATAYIYDAAGSLAGVDYSDDTPDIAYTFDRLGRQLSAVSSVSTNLFSYSPDTLELFSETQNGVSLTRLTDDQGRPAGIALGDDYRIFYGYDVFGRFASASSSVSSVVNYSRLPGTDLLTGYTLSSPVSNFQFQVSKSYEPHRDLITSVSNLWGASVISAYDYANDVVGRRVSRRDSGLAFVQPQSNSFGYNPCSEITDAVMHTNIYGYVFDPVGNRLVSSHNTETNSYVSNPLNQYTVISNFVNSIQIKPTYDADGNMTTNGLWSYTWDGENRLISVSSNGAPIAHFVYDHQSRRIAKNTSVRTIEFLYDGWAMIREKTATSLDSPTVKNYCYGLDLSDRLPNVGTIGGIWLVWTNTKLEYYTYDANGNVSELINERGEIVKHYEYEPFGNTTMMGGHDIDTNSFRFSTKYFDADVGVYYYEYRFYLHIFGRFISRDPLGDEAFLKQLLRGKTWRKQSYWRNLALEPSYLFSKNASVFLTDHLGLMAWGFKYHGQWCGPGWTGGQEKNSEDYDWPNSSTTYADYLDNCCRQHDACYAGWDLSKGDWSSSKRPQLDCDDDLCQCSKGGPNPNSASALGIRCYFCVAKEDESKGICCRFVF
jgi:RHS repeat-associated protein